MVINTDMSGKEIDKVLKSIFDAMNSDNDGKVVYIKRGKLVFEDGEALFDVTILE